MNALIPKTYYEFNPDIPLGTKVKFTKNLEPFCKAYDPDQAGSVGVVTRVEPRRLYVEWTNSHGALRGCCITPNNLDGIEIGV